MEDIEKWRKAGSIAAEAREHSKTILKKGMLLLDFAEKVEEKIRQLGGEPAFPINISLNDVAAHYTPVPGDKTLFEDQVVKVDLGVHVDGCVGGDTAYTVDLSGKYSELVRASENALKAAIEAVKADASLGKIGASIHREITSMGFSPIINLSGHGLGKFSVHQSPTIPNYDTGDRRKLEKGQVIAIEPFATNGKGEIYESTNSSIFSFLARKPVRNVIARSVLGDIEKFGILPFAARWLANAESPRTSYGLRELVRAGILREYPPLPDKNHGMVTQAEHSLLIGEEGKVEVLTQ